MSPVRVGPKPVAAMALSPPPPSPSSSSSSSSSWRAWLRHAVVPVEWHGSYSVDKLLVLLAYTDARPSRGRIFLVLVLTPLPALVVTLLCELVVLHDPTLGWRRNGAFLTRTWLRAAISAFAIDALLAQYVPHLRLPLARRVVMNATQGAVASATIVAIAETARVFPVPFTSGVTLPVYAVCSWLLRLLCGLREFERDPQPHETRRAMAHFLALLNVTTAQLYGYGLFGAAFARVPVRWQSLAAVVLVAIKTLSSRRQWHYAQALPAASGRHDWAAAHVAFGAHFFHALFVAAVLHKSTSLSILVAVVAVSTLHDLALVGLLRRRIARVTRLRHHDAKGLREIATTARVGPMSREALAPMDLEYLEAVRSLWQCREATLLRLYVGLFVPLVFVALVAAMQHLPNARYVPFVDGHALRDLARRLGLPFSTKLLTWVALLRSLDAHGASGGPSGLQQLAFALERMATIAQAKSLLAMLWVVDFSLRHNATTSRSSFNGSERIRHETASRTRRGLTFQFQWLREDPA